MKKSTNGRSRATRYLRMQQLLIVVLALMMVFQFSTPTLGGLVWASDDEASAERQSTEDYQTEELKQVEITADTDTEETVEQTAQDQNDTSVDVTDDDETSAEKADDVQEAICRPKKTIRILIRSTRLIRPIKPMMVQTMKPLKRMTSQVM